MPSPILLLVGLLYLINPVIRAQNIFTSSLDETRKALLPFSRGSAAKVYAHGGHGFFGSGSRRRHRSRLSRPSTRRRTTPSNTFLEALDEVEKAVYEAGAEKSRYIYNSRRLARLKNYVKLASQKGSYQFAQQALGHAIFMTSSKTRGKRSTSNAATNFIKALKRELGNKVFDKFMAVHGDTTLIFAIDHTGSMGDEIQAAKEIATFIVKRPRKERVNYILSPFNDPGTGPLVYKSESQGNEFVKAIKNLHAHGGGDYAELTFKGMLDAVSKAKEEPRWGSSMYVFTDATAKDATKDNIETLLDYAENFGLTINFFTTFTSSYKPFETIARKTCGLMLKFASSSDLLKLKSLTASSLKGETCIDDGVGYGATTEHHIQVDESIEKLLILVTTQNRYPTIVLRNPLGQMKTHKRISLQKGAIYELFYPRPAGVWKVSVTRGGKHEVVVKGTSTTNIDFEHFFVIVPRSGRNRAPFPISYPLSDRKSHLILTVAGAKKVRRTSMSLEIVDCRTNRRLFGAAVKPRGSTGSHFVSSFFPPRVPFRLVLKGKTEGGYSFRRMSRNIIETKTALVRVKYARNDFTIPRGGRSFVIFVIQNVGPTDWFNIFIKDRLGFRVRTGRLRFRIRRGGKRVFSEWFRAPYDAERGKSDPVVVSFTGLRSRVRAGKVVNLIAV